MKKKDLIARLNVLEEENRRRGEKKVKYSKWFVTLNPNTKVDYAKGYSESYIENELLDIITYLYNNLRKVIVINNPEHDFYKPHIEKCVVKYVFEKGEGRRKKDGTYPEGGGLIHAHIRIEVTHNSNISLSWARMKNLLEPRFMLGFGKKGWISTPRLISEDKSERYITKSLKYKKGFRWVVVGESDGAP